MPFAGARHDADRRHAEIARQAADVDLDALALGLVHQVDGDDHAVGDLEHLQHEVQVALERRGVDDDDRRVGPAEQQEVARDLFVVRRRQQRVGARQVHELVADLVELEAAFGARDRLARPVARVLLEARSAR